ncbi:MAG: phosphatidylglycerophosphatase A [Phycisphaerae bacterium]|nr:phosphatidylglycerophosphatase A [Phycisphaerae bacterium]
MMRRALMSGFGLGYAPVASGTFGSAGAVVIAFVLWLMARQVDSTPFVLNAAWVILTLGAGWVCVAYGSWAAQYYAGRSPKEGDPGQVVIDEFAGQWLSLVLIPLPSASLNRTLIALTLQFFLFRVFDVLKPPPGRRMEKLPAGWGILMDDLAAGVYANVIGQVVLRLIVAG